ncbi:hypothetical protein H0E84_12085 [Luteimonas sp. SJ-92]|uniref:DUF2171 domain-containing protein n=1 Tax=Luteimonas salinisoli TaxID=2752307 RepID=A0A853JET5_9GAMM|nr:hypothetical protein [Luteimonas salinisoli]NZA27119.1 hypothetical protein [Luteimonas salinisoli]
MPERIEVGCMVFVVDGELGVGAVREVRSASAELVVNIENAGDFVIPLDAVRDVHSGKVVLDVERLPAPVREALGHAHDAEDPDYAEPGSDEDREAL